MNKRIEHIDIAKGISIALVAMYHSKLKILFPDIMRIMSLCRVPLFFFLSGVFFSVSSKPSFFLIKKSEALLKPYFSVLIFLFLIDCYFNQDHLVWRFKGIFYGNGDTVEWTPMWFLTHMFSLYCFSYILFRYTGFNKISDTYKWVYILISLAIGISNIDTFWNASVQISGHTANLPGLPFSLDIMLITSALFIAGNMLKEKAINFIPNNILLVISIMFIIYVSIFTVSHIDLNKRTYESPIFATMGSISGIYIIMCASYWIKKHNAIKNFLIAIGSASLYILIFHFAISDIAYNFLSIYIPENSGTLLLAVSSFIVSITLPLAIKWAVNNNSFLALFFLPFSTNKLLQQTR